MKYHYSFIINIIINIYEPVKMYTCVYSYNGNLCDLATNYKELRMQRIVYQQFECN